MDGRTLQVVSSGPIPLAICNKFTLCTGGLLYFPGDSDEASLNPALNVAMLMWRYVASDLASSSSQHDKYQVFAQKQVDYVLGRNPMFGTAPFLFYSQVHRT